MTGLASQLLARFGEQTVAGFLLTLARITPLFAVAPLFSSRIVPMRARAVIALGLAVGLAPVAAHGSGRLPLDVLPLAGLMVKELVVGLAFALTLAILFAALQAAGSLLDTMIGFSFGSLVDPVTGAHSSVLAQLYALVGTMVFIAINGDAWVIQGLARTYDVVPMTGTPQMASMVGGVASAFAGIFGAALQVCAPVLLALVVTDAAVGVVARVVPQLNVFQVGFPAKAAVGLLLLGVSMPFVAGWLSDQLQGSVLSALHALRLA